MMSFYSFSSVKSKKEVRLSALVDYDEQALMVGETVPEQPMPFKVDEGKIFYDLLNFQEPFNFAISAKAYELLLANNFTGWRSFDISIQNRDEKYYGFQVLGKCGPVKRPQKPGFIIGCEFDYNTWDNSDFFCPLGTRKIFCTEKVKDVFIANNVTNVKIADLSTLEWYSV